MLNLNKIPLFKESLDALQVGLLPKKTSDQLTDLFKSIVSLTKWGKIDWNTIDHKQDIGCDPDNIILALEQLLKKPITNLDKEVYIERSTYEIPIIKANLDAIINHFDDVTCVAFEKFIFNPFVGYIIEVLSSDRMTVGLIKPIQENLFD